MGTEAAEEALREGRLDEALSLLQGAVRAKPAEAPLRVFLFQLLCIRGEWERALNQLNVCAEMDASALGMRAMYRDAVGGEVLRAEVFAGRRSPMLLGEPEPWLALLIESLSRSGRGEQEEASQLRAQAFDQAEPSSGSVDGQPFEWLADADPRLGPVLEAMINGRYYWVPFSRLVRVAVEEPTDLRDFVWIPASLQFANGGETPALIPVRYPGSESSEDGLLALARKTEWVDAGNGHFFGRGQRLFAADSDEFPLLQCREMVFNNRVDSSEAGP